MPPGFPSLPLGPFGIPELPCKLEPAPAPGPVPVLVPVVLLRCYILSLGLNIDI